jgi:hypothetical protein
MVRLMGAIAAVDRRTRYRLQVCHLGTGPQRENSRTEIRP